MESLASLEGEAGQTASYRHALADAFSQAPRTAFVCHVDKIMGKTNKDAVCALDEHQRLVGDALHQDDGVRGAPDSALEAGPVNCR